jgi:hypothetical protein
MSVLTITLATLFALCFRFRHHALQKALSYNDAKPIEHYGSSASDRASHDGDDP